MTKEEFKLAWSEQQTKTYNKSRKYTVGPLEFVMVDRDTGFPSLSGRVLWIKDFLRDKEIRVGCDSKYELVKLGWWIMRAAMRP